MARTNRGQRTGKKKRKKAKSPKAQADTTPEVAPGWLRDPDTGYYRVDLDWRPETIPSDSIRANPLLQNYTSSGPAYFYQDQKRHCVQCRETFVFSAKEQRFWYETLQFSMHTDAVRCVDCRRKRRTLKSAQVRYAKVAAFADSNEPEQLIEFASAYLDLIDRGAGGDSAKVIATARKARRLNKSWADPLYWEARGQQSAGRPKKAMELYEQFLSDDPHSPRRLRKDATDRVANLKNL